MNKGEREDKNKCTCKKSKRTYSRLIEALEQLDIEELQIAENKIYQLLKGSRKWKTEKS